MVVSFLSFGMACYGKAGRGEGSTHCGEESPQKSGAARRVTARLGDAGHGKARLHTLHPYGVQKCGQSRRGGAGQGGARQTHGISRGAAVCGKVRWGVARQGEAVPGMANTLPFKEGRSLRPGRAGRGRARLSAAWQTHSIPAGVLKFAGNTNNERKTQWKT